MSVKKYKTRKQRDEEFREKLRAIGGKMKLYRYADDFIATFEYEEDVKRFMQVLPKRFEKYGLKLHPVDSFRFLSRETAIKALKISLTKKGAEKINFEKLRKYAKLLRVKIEPYILAVTT